MTLPVPLSTAESILAVRCQLLRYPFGDGVVVDSAVSGSLVLP